MEIEALQMTPVKMSAQSHLGELEEKPAVKSFGEYLMDALGDVNKLQLNSDKMKAALAAGQVEDISSVVIASQKADIALQLTLQLRNRAISAYQELARMQV
jgi:flagellar hook-basal body complex protein FliE